MRFLSSFLSVYILISRNWDNTVFIIPDANATQEELGSYHSTLFVPLKEKWYLIFSSWGDHLAGEKWTGLLSQLLGLSHLPPLIWIFDKEMSPSNVSRLCCGNSLKLISKLKRDSTGSKSSRVTKQHTTHSTYLRPTSITCKGRQQYRNMKMLDWSNHEAGDWVILWGHHQNKVIIARRN